MILQTKFLLIFFLLCGIFTACSSGQAFRQTVTPGVRSAKKYTQYEFKIAPYKDCTIEKITLIRYYKGKSEEKNIENFSLVNLKTQTSVNPKDKVIPAGEYNVSFRSYETPSEVEGIELYLRIVGKKKAWHYSLTVKDKGNKALR